ncbi:MAG: PIN domain-containing protein [Kineosporiaceae bacterium]|nr:PIN domain-containing protein [Kineosporiaceae bacterium]MBK7624917.1 PIN domain-containing protein [Kineosporiaceae bacterium]
MYVLDMGVVLAMHRADHPAHDRVRPWFEELLDGTEQFAVPRPVWASFLRHATDPAIFVEPTPAATAFDFIDAVCAQPLFLPVEAGPRHLLLLRTLCVDAPALSSLVPVAVVAAIAAEHHCIVATLDEAITRFSGVSHLLLGH